jgi:oligosaccharide reducing-end xylanase
VRRVKRVISIFTVLLAILLTGCNALRPGGAGAVRTGEYRNLFAETGHSPSEIRMKIDSAFAQLFHGDADRDTVFYSAGTNANGPLAYICDTAHSDVRSEGMSYGMMIAVQLDKRAEFDALWNWARTFMYHDSPTHPSFGYFSWSMETNGAAIEDMPAPDGEEYFVTALYFASGRWGDGVGIYDYQSEATRLLSDLKNRATIAGQTIQGARTNIALFSPKWKMVRFTPDVANSEHTDPSYQLPAFYELWSHIAPRAERAFWRQAAAASRDFFQHAADRTTGLCPEYANFDGTPWAVPWNPGSVDFRFDAWRVAMNWSVDWSWWHADDRERNLSDRLQAFFESKDISRYGNQFKLSGKQLSPDHSTGLVAMNAVASLAARDARAKRFVEALWNAPVPSGFYRYYDGMLYLMGLLHCSGEFRVWMPQ